ncbi:MAG: hypothetical protein JNM17_06730 [Archangium sp.]|nr:hypothetical protein [Archangium sp.]
MKDEGALLRLFRAVVRAAGMSAPPRLLGLKDAAESLSITQRDLREMVVDGRVLARRRNGELRFPKSELARISPAMPQLGQRPVSAKTRARLKAASLKRKNTKR